jgi:hypothetical protein
MIGHYCGGQAGADYHKHTGKQARKTCGNARQRREKNASITPLNRAMRGLTPAHMHKTKQGGVAGVQDTPFSSAAAVAVCPE